MSSLKRGWVGPHLSAQNVLDNGQSVLRVGIAELNLEQVMGKPEFQLRVMTMILFPLINKSDLSINLYLPNIKTTSNHSAMGQPNIHSNLNTALHIACGQGAPSRKIFSFWGYKRVWTHCMRDCCGEH
jgi:hypothetical protein